jgi:hypothetical protein
VRPGLGQTQLALEVRQQAVITLVDAGAHDLRLDLVEPALQFVLVGRAQEAGSPLCEGVALDRSCGRLL